MSLENLEELSEIEELSEVLETETNIEIGTDIENTENIDNIGSINISDLDIVGETIKKSYATKKNTERNKKFIKLDNYWIQIGLDKPFWLASLIYIYFQANLIGETYLSIDDLSNYYYEDMSRNTYKHKDDFTSALYLLQEYYCSPVNGYDAGPMIFPLSMSTTPDSKNTKALLQYGIEYYDISKYYVSLYFYELAYIRSKVYNYNLTATTKAKIDMVKFLLLYLYIKNECGIKSVSSKGRYDVTFRKLEKDLNINRHTISKYLELLQEWKMLIMKKGSYTTHMATSITMTNNWETEVSKVLPISNI